MANMMTAEIRAGFDHLVKLSEALSQETPLRQAMVLYTIAMAGETGTDSATIERKLGVSAAAVSRTIRVLSEISYDRSEGHGLVTLELDPMDNRRRVIKINSKGEKLIQKVTTGLKALSK